MNFRKIVSLFIAFCFIVMLITGVLSYYKEYSRVIATIHTTFGVLFTVGVLSHIFNNFRPLKTYITSKFMVPIIAILGLALTGAYFQMQPFLSFMDQGARLKATSGNAASLFQYETLEMDTNKDIQLSVDLLRSEHFWHPQIAVWITDSLDQYIETIYVSKATAQGLFFGGRSKDNFKEFDEQKTGVGSYRRVNALPIWSHHRGVQYSDGMYVPTKDKPLVDGITGATFIDNFRLLSSINSISKFHLKLEINVAFDDNEFYSEYDFPDDEIFHNGTGQLGQPSIVYEAKIDMNDDSDFYIMKLVGHGHQSGQTGEIFTDMSKLTTANQIVERIVVGVKKA